MGHQATPNKRQLMFVREYLIDLNAKEAAIRAGYKAVNADKTGSQLLNHPVIAQEIQKEMDLRAKTTRITAEEVLKELYLIATTDLSQAFGDDNKLLPIKDMPIEIRRAISSIEVDEIWDGYGEEREVVGQTKKIKLWDKTKTLELLAKHLKLLTDKIEITGNTGLADRIKKARERSTKR